MVDVPYLYSDWALFQYIQDFSIPSDLQEARHAFGDFNGFADPRHAAMFGINGPGDWRWKAMLLSNMMYWAEEHAGDLNVGKPPSSTDRNAWQNIYDSLATILGCGDPKKRTTIVWAFRNSLTLSLLDQEIPIGGSSQEFKRRLVFGMPLVWNYHTDSTASREFKNWWKENYEAGRDMQAFAKSRGKMVCSVTEWKNNTDNCRMSLTKDCGDLFIADVTFTKNGDSPNWKTAEIKKVDIRANLYVDKVVSSRSIRRQRKALGGGYNYTFGDYNNPFSFSREIAIDDCITISYPPEAGGGSLKIICFSGASSISATGNLGEDYGALITRKNNGWQAFLYMAIDPAYVWEWSDKNHTYSWQKTTGWHAKKILENQYVKNNIRSDERDSVYSYCHGLWENSAFLQKFNEHFTTMRVMVPLLMAKRFQEQMFDNINNGAGLSVTDYNNDSNPATFRAIPYLDVSSLHNVFDQTFYQFDAERILQDARFSYSHCVVDLCPTVSDYPGLANGQFPVTFQNGVDVNLDDTYKKKKMVLTRIV